MDFQKVFQYTKDLKVLYVEDNKDLLLETYDVLEDYFLSVDSAENGKIALQKYKTYAQENSFYYDLVITDINMPVMDGMELIKNIHAIHHDQSIIVFSAYNESSRLTDLIQEGITNFVMKPIAPLQLMSILYKTTKSIYNQKELIKHQKEIEELNENLDAKVQEQAREILFTRQIAIETIVNMVESYDDETGSHIKRIEAYTQLMIDKVPNTSNCPKELRDSIPFASLLHDIGKMMIPKHILFKPGTLTDEEFNIIKTHAPLGGEVLKKANITFKETFNKDSFLKVASDIAMYHHEKWNGLGYPEGLKGEEIPSFARIVSVADVYDAIRSKRVYKEGRSHKEALTIIKEESGKSFDPSIVKIFVELNQEFDRIFTNHS